MTRLREAARAAAARAIATSREFCGNQRAAALQAFADEGIKPTADDISAAFAQAEIIWAGYRADAFENGRF